MSLLLEPYGALVDELGDTMRADEQSAFPIHGEMKIAALRDVLDTHGQWVSRSTLPRTQSRAVLVCVGRKARAAHRPALYRAGPELEQPLAVARDIYLFAGGAQVGRRQRDRGGLFAAPSGAPPHRAPGATGTAVSLRRHSGQPDRPEMLPIDLLRCKLSFFGAIRFDPRSDRWVRINMYKNAPFPHELDRHPADDWSYPRLTQQEQKS